MTKVRKMQIDRDRKLGRLYSAAQAGEGRLSAGVSNICTFSRRVRDPEDVAAAKERLRAKLHRNQVRTSLALMDSGEGPRGLLRPKTFGKSSHGLVGNAQPSSAPSPSHCFVPSRFCLHLIVPRRPMPSIDCCATLTPSAASLPSSLLPSPPCSLLSFTSTPAEVPERSDPKDSTALPVFSSLTCHLHSPYSHAQKASSARQAQSPGVRNVSCAVLPVADPGVDGSGSFPHADPSLRGVEADGASLSVAAQAVGHWRPAAAARARSRRGGAHGQLRGEALRGSLRGGREGGASAAGNRRTPACWSVPSCKERQTNGGGGEERADTSPPSPSSLCDLPLPFDPPSSHLFPFSPFITSISLSSWSR